MFDMNALSTGAKEIHQIFESLFYGLITFFLLLGVILEYFKFPLGGSPAFGTLVGRVFIAVVLLAAYPEISNLMADMSDSVAQKLGDLNQFKLVLTKMGEKWKEISISWVSLKDATLLLISFLTFFLLYASVYVVEALLLYTWVVLYAFSPLLIALYVLPATSAATKGLFRSLIEVSCWKIVWSALATLLWSVAISDINHPGTQISFLTAILYNLFLAASVLLTPMVVHALAGAGLSEVGKTMATMATTAVAMAPAQILGAPAIVKGKAISMGKAGAQKSWSGVKNRFTSSHNSKNRER